MHFLHSHDKTLTVPLDSHAILKHPAGTPDYMSTEQRLTAVGITGTGPRDFASYIVGENSTKR